MKLPKSYIKKYGITKEAWRKYKASLGKRKTTKKKVIRVKKTKTKRRSMPRKKKRYRRSRRLALAPTIGALSSLAQTAPSGRTIISDLMKGDFEGLLYDAREVFTGIDSNGAFHWDWIAKTYIPPIAGVFVHRAMNALGVNRYLGKVPLIGKYVSI